MAFEATANGEAALPAPAVEALRRAVDGVADLDPRQISGAELNETIEALQRIRARLDGVTAGLIGVWDALLIWADDDARSGRAWMIQRCRMPGPEAGALITLARGLRDAPVARRALVAGEIGVAQARRLIRAVRHDPEAFTRDEQMLVEQAKRLRYSQFHRAVSYWEQLADPDGAERSADGLDDERRVHVSETFEGATVVDGVLDAVGGSIVRGVLGDIEHELFAADWSEAKERLGHDPTPSDLARTTTQRRADALVVMAIRAATAPPDGQVPRPLFTVYVDYPTLTGRILERSNGTVVTPGQVAPWLGCADLERVVFDGPSRVLDVGVRQRVFRGATRRAVEVRDRYCTGFGCEEPIERCDVDHRTPFSYGGWTIQGNGRLACPYHNPGRRKKRQRRHTLSDEAAGSGPDPP